VRPALTAPVPCEREPVELISCPFCAWRYAGLAGGRRHHEVFAEHLAGVHVDLPPEERQRRTREHGQRGLLVTPLVPLASK